MISQPTRAVSVAENATREGPHAEPISWSRLRSGSRLGSDSGRPLRAAPSAQEHSALELRASRSVPGGCGTDDKGRGQAPPLHLTCAVDRYFLGFASCALAAARRATGMRNGEQDIGAGPCELPLPLGRVGPPRRDPVTCSRRVVSRWRHLLATEQVSAPPLEAASSCLPSEAG